MTEQKDWKKQYETLLTEHEERTAADAEIGQLLTRTVLRLTLAASGFDAQLDPHLKNIRDAVRSGVNASLRENLDRLSDSLMHFSEEADAGGEAASRIAGRLVAHLQLSKKTANEVRGLLESLISQPQQMNEEDLDRLAGLLDQSNSEQSDSANGGLFGRLLGSKSASKEATSSEATNQILLNLLEQASWPGHWGEEISRLKNRLASQTTGDEWVKVLEDLLELSAKSYGEVKAEIKEAEDFLGELTQRLQDLDEHLRMAHDGHGEVVKQGQKLSDEVSAQVGGLESSVQSATDLQQLKEDVSKRLNAIQQSMSSFLDTEQQWYQQTGSNEDQLRERLKELEKESNDLRYRMLEAHHLALQDAVTELPNRMAYDERVAQEFARWKRFSEPLSMLIWDVDDFKSINDRFGHQAGDKALHVIASSLRGRLRETDFIARYGGEEFVTLLCGTDGEEALKVAEQMRQGVVESGFHSGGKAIKITISCGISRFTEGDGIDSVFARADKALYRAKRNGKNRCEVA